MTLTLIARNPFTRQIGLAMASGSDDCIGGSLVEAVAADAARPALIVVQGKGDRQQHEVLSTLHRDGRGAADMLAHLQATDSALPLRQILIAPLDGEMAAYTGNMCMGWAGDIGEEHLVAAGNMLASDRVLKAMKRAYMSDLHAPMRYRLLAALREGIAAGGDLRGHASAGIVIAGAQALRHQVTAQPQPLQSLAALVA